MSESKNDFITFYQKYISQIRGQSCPMFPSCSVYALEAYSNYNSAIATELTADRLMRCGHDRNYYKLKYIAGNFLLVDPIKKNLNLPDLSRGETGIENCFHDVDNDDSTLCFIRFLISKKLFSQAHLEIQRKIFDHQLSRELFMNDLSCYLAAGEEEKAIYEYESAIPLEYKSDPYILHKIAIANYKLNNLGTAIQTDSLVLKNCTDQRLIAGATSIISLSFCRQKNWTMAEDIYMSYSKNNEKLEIINQNINLIRDRKSQKEKSPKIAGILSIIPGAGYLYTKHKQTAISSFFLNGLFSFATASSLSTKNYGVALISGVFGLAFYSANIYGSINSAKRYNSQLDATTINRIESNSQLIINP